MARKPLTPEQKAQRSEYNRRRYLLSGGRTPEQKARDRQRSVSRTPEQRARQNEANKRYRASMTPEQKAETAKRRRLWFQALSPEKRARIHMRSGLRKKYGITLKEYAALAASQQHRCAICSGGNRQWNLAVDHCHVTGRIRGLLCNNCNAGIGLLGDTAAAMVPAIQYLERAESGG
jgi:hypothetical protein